MINRTFTLLLTLFLLPIIFRAIGQAKGPDLQTAFKQADNVYGKDTAAGYRQFQLVYKRALQMHDQVIEVKCMNLFTEYFWNLRNYSTAKNWGLKSISQAEFYKNDILAGDACSMTGLVFYDDGKYLQAIAYYQRAIKHYQIKPADQRLALAYVNLGVAERKAGRFVTANDSYFKAAGIFQKLKDNSDLASVYTAIGNCYVQMENYTLATSYHLQSLRIATRLGDNDGKAMTMDNLGYVYKQINKPDSAILYLTQVIRIRTATRDSVLLATPYQNIGSAWEQKGDLQKAMRYFLISMRIAKKYHLEEQQARGNVDLAGLFLAQRHYSEAAKALIAAEKTAEKLVLADLLADIAEWNSKLSEAMGNDHLAMHFYKKRDHIRDSLITSKKNTAIAELEVKFKVRERERDISELHMRDRLSQKMLSQQRLSILALVAAALLLTALSFLAFYSFRQQKRGNKLVKELMRELQHRTKNNLQILSSLLQLQIESQENESVKKALQETEVRLNTMNIMYSKLYSGQATSTVDMAVYLNSLLRHIQDSFSHERKKINVESDLDSIVLPVDRAVTIGLILNELSTNSIRHAVNKTGLILDVSLKLKAEGIAELSIGDNGKVKKKQDKEAHTSFGLRIVGLMIEQIEGSVATSPENPYSYRIEFKI